MPGDTLATGDLDGVIQDTGEAAITETIHTATEEEGLLLTTTIDIILQTERMLLTETTFQTEIILPTEIVSLIETAIQQTEITPIDQTVILITEEVHL
jgi:hypothetical protein